MIKRVYNESKGIQKDFECDINAWYVCEKDVLGSGMDDRVVVDPRQKPSYFQAIFQSSSCQRIQKSAASVYFTV